MHHGHSGILRRVVAVCFAAVLFVMLAGLSGCAYLQWRQAKQQQRAQLKKNPADPALARDYPPQDRYRLAGPIPLPAQPPPPPPAALRREKTTALVGWASVDIKRGYYAILLPSGTYDLLFFTDRDGDGLYVTSEVVGRTPPDSPVVVSAATAADGIAVEAPEVAIDLQN